MQLLGRYILSEFKDRHRDANSQVDAWEAEAKTAKWETPADIKARYASASIRPKNHVVFNIKGNQYRLLVQVSYKNKVALIKAAGTHDEYMKWKI
jgi:mRNA interferase HigB